MALIGNVGHFDEKVENFSEYQDRMLAFMEANNIGDVKKVNVFYHVWGLEDTQF